MSPRRKRLILIGVAVAGIVAIAAWVFFVGPVLIVRQIHSHNRNAVDWFCRLGVSPNRDAWLIGGVFHCAIASGDSNIVMMLIQKGADLNRIDGYGMTPLHVATRQGDLVMMSLLVTHGADASGRDRDGATALDVATHEGLEAPRRYLRELAMKTNPTQPNNARTR